MRVLDFTRLMASMLQGFLRIRSPLKFKKCCTVPTASQSPKFRESAALAGLKSALLSLKCSSQNPKFTNS